MLCLAPQSFQKADNNYSAELSCFFLLAREERAKQEWNKMTCVFVLWQVYQKLFFFFLLLEEGIRFFEHLTLQLYTDGQFPSLHQHLRHWMLDYTHCYTKKRGKKNKKIKVIAIDSCTACITFCTENPSTIFFLLININSEWFEFTASTITVHVDMTQKRQERQERTILLWLQLKARRCPTLSNHLSHFKGLHTATVTSMGDRFLNQRVHKNRSCLSANRFSRCRLSSRAIKETSIFIPATSPCFFFFTLTFTVEIHQ